MDVDRAFVQEDYVSTIPKHRSEKIQELSDENIVPKTSLMVEDLLKILPKIQSNNKNSHSFIPIVSVCLFSLHHES